MNQAKKAALLGIFLAFAVVMSLLEQMLPPFPFVPPNVKIGLSNIVILYSIFFVGKKEAFLLGGLKSGFVLLMRGPLACMLSLGGGMMSILCIILVSNLAKERFSYIPLSICGATVHNITQIFMYSLLLQTNLLAYYLPFLVLAGIIMGIATGSLLNLVVPIVHKVNK